MSDCSAKDVAAFAAFAAFADVANAADVADAADAADAADVRVGVDFCGLSAVVFVLSAVVFVLLSAVVFVGGILGCSRVRAEVELAEVELAEVDLADKKELAEDTNLISSFWWPPCGFLFNTVAVIAAAAMIAITTRIPAL